MKKRLKRMYLKKDGKNSSAKELFFSPNPDYISDVSDQVK
jgi:hypothetical protein